MDPKGGQEQRVNLASIEEAVVLGQRTDHAKRLAIAKSRKNCHQLFFANGQPLECAGIVLNDQVGNLGLSGVPRGEHGSRVRPREPGGKTRRD